MAMISLMLAMNVLLHLDLVQSHDESCYSRDNIDERGLKDYYKVIGVWKEIGEGTPLAGTHLLEAISQLRPGASSVFALVIEEANRLVPAEPLADPKQMIDQINKELTSKFECSIANVTIQYRDDEPRETIFTNVTEQLEALGSINVLISEERVRVATALEDAKRTLQSLDTSELTSEYRRLVTSPVDRLWEQTQEIVSVTSHKSPEDFTKFLQTCLDSQTGLVWLAQQANQVLADGCVWSESVTYRYVQTIEKLAKIHGTDLNNLSSIEEQMKEKILARAHQMLPEEAFQALDNAEKILGLFVGYEGNQQHPVGFDEALQTILDSRPTSVKYKYCITDSVLFACNKNSTCVDAFMQAVAYDLSRLQFSIPVCGTYIDESGWNLYEGRMTGETIHDTADFIFKRASGIYK